VDAESQASANHGFQGKQRVLGEESSLPPPSNAPEWTIKRGHKPATPEPQPPPPTPSESDLLDHQLSHSEGSSDSDDHDE